MKIIEKMILEEFDNSIKELVNNEFLKRFLEKYMLRAHGMLLKQLGTLYDDILHSLRMPENKAKDFLLKNSNSFNISFVRFMYRLAKKEYDNNNLNPSLMPSGEELVFLIEEKHKKNKKEKEETKNKEQEKEKERLRNMSPEEIEKEKEVNKLKSIYGGEENLKHGRGLGT